MNIEKTETVIISPHFDDEIIGVYSVLMNPLVKPIIVYLQEDEERKKEALNLKKFIDRIQVQMFQKNIPPIFLNPKNTLFFPDPIYEFHPDHRKWGAIGEDLLRRGFNVIFYSINMQAPYIHELNDFKQKRHLLEKVYPSQKKLWSNDARYYLFEGMNRWLM
jgi:hypothetical protein